VSTFYIVGKAEKQAIRWELKVGQSDKIVFYIVDKLKEQAIRREPKVGQSAVSIFYILRGRLVVGGLKNRRIVVSKGRTEWFTMFQMPIFLIDAYYTM